MERWKIAGRLLRGIDGVYAMFAKQWIKVSEFLPQSANDEELGLAQQDYARK